MVFVAEDRCDVKDIHMRTSLQTLNIVPNSHQDPVPTPLSSLKPKWSKRYVSPYGAGLCNLLGHEGIQCIAGGYGRRVTLRRAAGPSPPSEPQASTTSCYQELTPSLPNKFRVYMFIRVA